MRRRWITLRRPVVEKAGRTAVLGAIEGAGSRLQNRDRCFDPALVGRDDRRDAVGDLGNWRRRSLLPSRGRSPRIWAARPTGPTSKRTVTWIGCGKWRQPGSRWLWSSTVGGRPPRSAGVAKLGSRLRGDPLGEFRQDPRPLLGGLRTRRPWTILPLAAQHPFGLGERHVDQRRPGDVPGPRYARGSTFGGRGRWENPAGVGPDDQFVGVPWARARPDGSGSRHGARRFEHARIARGRRSDAARSGWKRP